MRKLKLLILLLMLVPAALIAGDTERVYIEAVPVSEQAIDIFPDGAAPAKLDPALYCHGEWQGPTSVAVSGYFEGNEYYAVYQDPTETGCTNTFPFKVERVIWTLNNNTASDLTLAVQPIIYAADLLSPSQPKPGVVWFRGPVYSFVLPASMTAQVNFPITGLCVDGPYFAGVYCPDYIGGGLLNLTTDDGMTSPFLLRESATFNNWRGLWNDLIVDHGFPGNLRLWSDGQNSDGADCDSCSLVIEPGVDLWDLPRDGNFAYQAGTYFATYPLPADFFGPGSDPFDGVILMQGSALITDPPGILGASNAVIERKDSAFLPTDGAWDVVDLEILALNLIGTAPIQVTYDGGMYSESWYVKLCLSEVPFQYGFMEINRDCCKGGIFSAGMAFRPRYVFTHMVLGERVYDFGLAGSPHTFYWENGGKWSTIIHPPYVYNYSPGLVKHDHDFNPVTSDITIGQSTKFLRCENWSVHTGLPPFCYFADPCCCVGLTGDADCSGHPGDIEPDISDIVRIIDFLYLSHDPLCCIMEADVDASGPSDPLDPVSAVDISDITYLIDHLYLSHKPLPSCP